MIKKILGITAIVFVVLIITAIMLAPLWYYIGNGNSIYNWEWHGDKHIKDSTEGFSESFIGTIILGILILILLVGVISAWVEDNWDDIKLWTSKKWKTEVEQNG